MNPIEPFRRAGAFAMRDISFQAGMNVTALHIAYGALAYWYRATWRVEVSSRRTVLYGTQTQRFWTNFMDTWIRAALISLSNDTDLIWIVWWSAELWGVSRLNQQNTHWKADVCRNDWISCPNGRQQRKWRRLFAPCQWKSSRNGLSSAGRECWTLWRCICLISPTLLSPVLSYSYHSSRQWRSRSWEISSSRPLSPWCAVNLLKPELAEIPVKSPGNFFFLLSKDMFVGWKYPNKHLIQYWKKIHWCCVMQMQMSECVVSLVLPEFEAITRCTWTTSLLSASGGSWCPCSGTVLCKQNNWVRCSLACVPIDG